MSERLTAEAYFDYIKRLLSLGYTKLGSASMASVFLSPVDPNVAVKVFKTQDAAYRQWLEVIASYPNNPYLPKITSIHYFKNSPGIGIAFMERLRPMPKTNKEWWRLDLVLRSHIPEDSLLRPPKGIKDGKRRHILAWSLSTQWPIVIQAAAIASKAGEVKPEFVQALKLIGRASRGKNNFVDIYHSNVMLRGPQLVFTDPVNTGV